MDYKWGIYTGVFGSFRLVGDDGDFSTEFSDVSETQNGGAFFFSTIFGI